MKSKRSRVGRNFQAIIPPLLTAKERADDKAKYLSSRPYLRSPNGLNSIQYKLTETICNIGNPDRQYEQPILPPVTSKPPLISKTLYGKVVAKSRKQHQAALEARRRQLQSRRKSTRRRGMRCQNYKEWDDPESYSSEDVGAELSQVEFSPDEQCSARRKKRARSGRGVKPYLPKKRYVPNRIKPVVIDLVDLSDSPETPSKPIAKQFRLGPPIKGSHYRTTPQRRLIHTQQRMRYAYVPQPSLPIGNLSQARRLQHKVLNNLGVNHLPFQSPPSKRKVIGKLMGYRQSPNNAMIPVIEL